MFARLYHPLILRGACARTCKCTCRCLTTSERVSFLELLLWSRQNMSSTNESQNSGSEAAAIPGSSTNSDTKQSVKGSTKDRHGCLFCRIVDGNEPASKDKIIFQNEEFVVFPDIRPASKHHLLVVTKEHIRDAKCLTPSQSELVQRMVDTGKKALSERVKSELGSAESSESSPEQEEAVSNALLGFHWPPFHTVSHLHLHVISPPNTMGLAGRLMFRPNSFWFVQASWVQQRLNQSSKIQSSAAS